jgi:hypothetical protein
LKFYLKVVKKSAAMEINVGDGILMQPGILSIGRYTSIMPPFFLLMEIIKNHILDSFDTRKDPETTNIR